MTQEQSRKTKSMADDKLRSLRTNDLPVELSERVPARLFRSVQLELIETDLHLRVLPLQAARFLLQVILTTISIICYLQTTILGGTHW